MVGDKVEFEFNLKKMEGIIIDFHDNEIEVVYVDAETPPDFTRKCIKRDKIIQHGKSDKKLVAKLLKSAKNCMNTKVEGRYDFVRKERTFGYAWPYEYAKKCREVLSTNCLLWRYKGG